MSEEELKRLFDIFQDCWRYLKDHSNPDDSEEFWNRLRDDGSAIGQKYEFGTEHRLAADLVVAANGVIQRYYRRDK